MERPRAARDALASKSKFPLDPAEQKRCSAHQKWEADVKAEKDAFDKRRLEQSWDDVERRCVEEFAAVHDELPHYAVLKLQARIDDYDFSAKGFAIRIDDPVFDVDHVQERRSGVVVTSRDGSGNIFRCEIDDSGGLYLYDAVATGEAGEVHPGLAGPDVGKLSGFIRMPDESTAKSLSKRIKRDEVSLSNVFLEIVFKPLPYGETPYVCARGSLLNARAMVMWRGDPIGFRFSVGGQPVGDWQAFDGPQTPE